MSSLLTMLNDRLNEEIFKIYTKVDQSLFIDKDSSSNITLSKVSSNQSQRWYLRYDTSKGAYTILSQENNSLALTLEYPSLKLVVKNLSQSNEQYWLISNNVNSSAFTISSYKNPNLCLSVSSNKNLVISTINVSDNTKFLFKQPIKDSLNNKVFRLENKLYNLSISVLNSSIPKVLNYSTTNPSGSTAINKNFAWKFESVDDMFGIFRLKSMTSNQYYLCCTDLPYVQLNSPGITAGDHAKWRVYYGDEARDVVKLVNLANNKVLACDGGNVTAIFDSSAGAERFWQLTKINL